jgi:hypothetical protein
MEGVFVCITPGKAQKKEGLVWAPVGGCACRLEKKTPRTRWRRGRPHTTSGMGHGLSIIRNPSQGSDTHASPMLPA